jgi:hypothetical protein
MRGALVRNGAQVVNLRGDLGFWYSPHTELLSDRLPRRGYVAGYSSMRVKMQGSWTGAGLVQCQRFGGCLACTVAGQRPHLPRRYLRSGVSVRDMDTFQDTFLDGTDFGTGRATRRTACPYDSSSNALARRASRTGPTRGNDCSGRKSTRH